MIDSFNFFDLYGYLIPGVMALALLIVPVSLATGLHASDLVPSGLDVIPLLIFAYVFGLILQRLAEWALPSTVHRGHDDAQGARPSDVLLDAADSRLPAATKTALLAEAVRRRWVSAAATWKDVGPGERKAVFFNFRTELVRAGFVRYVEQYQGMYVMCRGLALSLLLTWPMFITWSVLSLNIAQLDLRLRVGTAALLLSTIVALRFSYAQVLEVRGLTPKSAGSKCRRPSVRKMWVGATIGGVAAGVILDAHVPLTPIYAAIMLPMGLVLLRGGLLFRHAHLDFAWTFATTVYREALVVSRAAQPPESAVAPGPTSSSSSGEADD